MSESESESINHVVDRANTKLTAIRQQHAAGADG